MRWCLLCLATLSIVALCGAESAPRVQATIYSAENCPPCRRFVAAVKKEMPPDGWIVREASDKDAATAHIVLTRQVDPADNIDLFPTTIIRSNGREVDRIRGYISPTKLAQAIRAQQSKQ